MTARTHDRAKLGTVEFLAHARYGVPVREGEHADYYRGSGDDAEMFRDDTEVESFPTEAAARKWMTRRAKATLSKGVEFCGGDIERITWEPDEFPDEEYGTILDAVPVCTRRWYIDVDGDVDDIVDWPDR